jgi:secondary thiamine-phosphate synthase enzyme
MIYSEYINNETKGFGDIKDITGEVKKIVSRSNINAGIATVSIMGSTAAIAAIEYEPGLVKDLMNALEIIAPSQGKYAHDAKWHDGNGFSHIRASLIGASKTFPISLKTLMLGTWQQIVLIDFDNRPRSRKVFVQVMGE